MSINWVEVILESESIDHVWNRIFSNLLAIASEVSSPVALHESTVVPDRLLSEAAWELWEGFPSIKERTSVLLDSWTNDSSTGNKAVLILDALSLRELPIILGAMTARDISADGIRVTGSECPSTTDFFAKALGAASRSTLANNKKPKSFLPFNGDCFTDVQGMSFEDCRVPPEPNVFIWHSWLDDLIHVQGKLPDQIAAITLSTLQSDGFWSFIDRLRQGRRLVITADHGYAVSKRFSSEIEDVDGVDALRSVLGASRNKAETSPWQKTFVPPIVMSNNGHLVVMGQRKWKVQGGIPPACHGGMSLLEVAVPFIELPAI